METYTKEQLKELGIPFYEDFLPILREFLEGNKYYNVNPSTIDEWEGNTHEYQNYYQYTDYYETIKDRKGPMDLGDIVFYINYPY